LQVEIEDNRYPHIIIKECTYLASLPNMRQRTTGIHVLSHVRWGKSRFDKREVLQEKAAHREADRVLAGRDRRQ